MILPSGCLLAPALREQHVGASASETPMRVNVMLRDRARSHGQYVCVFYVHAVSVTYTHNTVPAGAFRGRIRTGHVNRPRDPIVRETRIHLYTIQFVLVCLAVDR